MSQREIILAAIETALSGVAGGRVYRSRREQIPLLPAVLIEPETADADEQVLTRLDHELMISVSALDKGDTPDTAADITLDAIHAAIMADPSLGLGSEVQVRQGFKTEWNFSDYDYVKATNRYTITYQTEAGAF